MQSNYYIKYGSNPNKKTIFQLQIPFVEKIDNQLDSYTDQILNMDSNKSKEISNKSDTL